MGDDGVWRRPVGCGAPEEEMMQNAVAFANNDVITIAWSYGRKPAGCMGFTIYRIDNKGGKEFGLHEGICG